MSMIQFRVLSAACAFTLIGLSSVSAAVPSPAFVDAKGGADSGTCPITSPCLTLNYALSKITAGGQVVVLTPAAFGPINLTGSVTITGTAPDDAVRIIADSSAAPGCIGTSAGSCGTNSNYAVQIAAGVNDIVQIKHVRMEAGSSGGIGALLFSSGGQIQLSNDVFVGNSTANFPIVQLAPNNTGTTQAQAYFSYDDIGLSNSGTNAGAVQAVPVGNTSLKLYFNHAQIHNAAYGIRPDGTSLAGPSVVLSIFVSDSELFSLAYFGANAVGSSGTGTVNAVYDNLKVTNAGGAGVKANGLQSFVWLTNSTVTGNGIGVFAQNSGTIYTLQNNTIQGNGTPISGVLNPLSVQ